MPVVVYCCRVFPVGPVSVSISPEKPFGSLRDHLRPPFGCVGSLRVCVRNRAVGNTVEKSVSETVHSL